MTSITNYDKHLNIMLLWIPLVLSVCFGLARKMRTYIHECINCVQTQLQISLVQCLYSLGTSHSKTLYESMARTLRRSNSHNGKQMIKMPWKWWKKARKWCSFPVNVAWYVLSDRKVWWFSRNDFDQTITILHNVIQAKIHR